MTEVPYSVVLSVAGAADTDPRTVKKVLAGEASKSRAAKRILAEFQKRGITPKSPEPTTK